MTTIDIEPGDLFGRDNRPYGVFSTSDQGPRVGVRYRATVIDLLELLGDQTFDSDSLNVFMGQGPQRWSEVRTQIQAMLDDADVPERAVHALGDVRLHLPIHIGDYVDFYCSEHHASNLGRLFRPGAEPLAPNWKHLPIGYHGRSQTVVVTGTDIHRPCGQRRGEAGPEFGPSTRLDIETELAFVVGIGSELGSRIGTAEFDDHIFGVMVFNDWSARDIQAWEYVPLGPHLGKSFASTISAWVTPMAALESARVPTPTQGPKLPYLHMDQPWGLDIVFEVEWNGTVVSRPPYKETYWSPSQMLAQLTVNGASSRAGDIFASGTVSGTQKEQRGAFIELTWGGAEPVTVGDGVRTFLEDGDEVVIRAAATGADGSRLGLGECRGRILPARDLGA